ncbi:hypothetical protein HanPSC8_Chr01g0027621 [Helianthus annuus]|nr:hypothetical protein HanPSC8_Chr01g0027621 [Helianthus annuus]
MKYISTIRMAWFIRCFSPCVSLNLLSNYSSLPVLFARDIGKECICDMFLNLELFIEDKRY